MKKIVIASLMALLLCPTMMHAQQPEEGVAHHAVKVSIISPLIGSPSVSYEYRLGKRFGVQADLGGTLFKAWGRDMQPYGFFAQLQGRFYLNNQRRNGVMPFFALGVNYTHAWEYFDVFDHNEGWDIITQRYVLRDNAVRPSLMFGLKVNIPFGLTVESAIGFRMGDGIEWRSPVNGVSAPNYLSTICTTRIGWAF